MRRFLDVLYAASGWLAGLCMIGVLLMVLLSIASRLFGFSAPGTDAYAGYAMAGAGFLALASTLKRGEHIRVTLLLNTLQGPAHRWLECTAHAIAVLLSAFLAWYACRLVWQSIEYNDISTGLDATPLWIPQLTMAVGTVVFFVAFVDELVLTLAGRRRAAPEPEVPHE
jgi:TRAP-type C4-dicarboxylate transport system permease small subunit